MRRLGDEAGVPRGLIEGETESCGDGEVYPSTIYAHGVIAGSRRGAVGADRSVAFPYRKRGEWLLSCGFKV